MTRFVKRLLIFFFCLLALVLLLVMCAGMTAVSALKEKSTAAVAADSNTTISVAATGATITTPLTPKMGVLLLDVSLCPEQGATTYSSMQSGCLNNQCKTILEFADKPLPQDLTINRRYNGQCVSQTIPNIQQYYTIVGYRASVHLNQAVKQQMQLPATLPALTQTPDATPASFMMTTLGSETVIKLEYASPVETDTLMLGEVPLFMRYTPAAQ